MVSFSGVAKNNSKDNINHLENQLSVDKSTVVRL